MVREKASPTPDNSLFLTTALSFVIPRACDFFGAS